VKGSGKRLTRTYDASQINFLNYGCRFQGCVSGMFFPLSWLPMIYDVFPKHKHLKAMGYTTFFANSFGISSYTFYFVAYANKPLSHPKDEALEQYRLFPDLVKVSFS